jgi:hypothetical protein
LSYLLMVPSLAPDGAYPWLYRHVERRLPESTRPTIFLEEREIGRSQCDWCMLAGSSLAWCEASNQGDARA